MPHEAVLVFGEVRERPWVKRACEQACWPPCSMDRLARPALVEVPPPGPRARVSIVHRVGRWRVVVGQRVGARERRERGNEQARVVGAWRAGVRARGGGRERERVGQKRRVLRGERVKEPSHAVELCTVSPADSDAYS